MSVIAALFPGQGSQKVGMGEEFYREYDVVREIFDMTEEITRINISKLCFKGPMEDLTMTVNLQPAVTAVNLACLAVIARENIAYQYCAGHSLGEYGALCVVHIDAHIDWRDERNGVGEGYSSGMRRASEMPWVEAMLRKPGSMPSAAIWSRWGVR